MLLYNQLAIINYLCTNPLWVGDFVMADIARSLFLLSVTLRQKEKGSLNSYSAYIAIVATNFVM